MYIYLLSLQSVSFNYLTPYNYSNYNRLSVVVEGYCRGISKGSHNLQLHVNTCPYYHYNSYDTSTGWYALTRSIIEEIREGTNVIAGEL